MPTTDVTKPPGKSGRSKGKGERKKKANVRSPAPVQLQTPEPVEPQKADQNLQSQPEPVVVESPAMDQPPAAAEPVEAVAAVESVAALPGPAPEAAPSPAALEHAAPEPLAPEPVAPKAAEAPPAEITLVSLQTIANAYRDYTRKSLEEFGSFVEQLSGARSLDKAMTVQSEFVKRAYENSVAESQKICELHTRLARQALDPFKGLAGKASPTQDKR